MNDLDMCVGYSLAVLHGTNSETSTPLAFLTTKASKDPCRNLLFLIEFSLFSIEKHDLKSRRKNYVENKFQFFSQVLYKLTGTHIQDVVCSPQKFGFGVYGDMAVHNFGRSCF